MHIYILLTIILKAKVLSWILNQKVFCFGFALWGGGREILAVQFGRE